GIEIKAFASAQFRRSQQPFVLIGANVAHSGVGGPCQLVDGVFLAGRQTALFDRRTESRQMLGNEGEGFVRQFHAVFSRCLQKCGSIMPQMPGWSDGLTIRVWVSGLISSLARMDNWLQWRLLLRRVRLLSKRFG